MDRRALEGRVGAGLLQVMRRAEEGQEFAARQQGMHPTDFRCLGYLLAQDSPVSPRDIIAYLGLTSGAGTALLDRLESAGFIRRVPHRDDRRSVLIILEKAAAAAPLALHERIRASYAAATADLSDADLEAIATYLERVQALSEQTNLGLYQQAEAERPALQNTETDSRKNR
ncbi:MarR family winged helix-turn-helix transcriptional regulator [Devosia sp.]|uniref:MarR family winged helix-turn-helix transcriptional regulator n=1 Tax=Devosia sp. TaxID=1871048 RepID=UPI002AFE1EC2|nr:MarR family transcriptional regulator [Devosia sp.]